MIPFTSTELERLIMLITIADYRHDGELRTKLERALTLQRQREVINKHPI